MQIKHNEIDDFNTDIRLLREITSKLPQSLIQRQSVARISSLLRAKNQVSSHRRQQVDRSHSWLRKKGADIQNIYDKIQKRDVALERTLQSQHQDSYFYLELTQQTLPEYLQKAYEYSSMNLLQHAMTTHSVRSRLIDRAVSQINYVDKEKRLRVSWQGERVPQQREIYLKIAKSVVKKDTSRQQVLKDFLRELQTAFIEFRENSIWDIFAAQLSHYNADHQAGDNVSQMALESLRLVQKEFQKRLQGKDIERYVAVNYLQKIEGRVHDQKDTTWVKAWTYMLAGLHKNVLETVSQKHKNYSEFMNGYASVSESLNNAHPQVKRIEPHQDIRDMFYNQVLFCLGGETKYVSEEVCSSLSLQLIWLILRTSAIFSSLTQKSIKFQQLRQRAMNSYKDCSSDPQLMRQILYLMDYKSILALGPNILMTKDDHLHFTLILSAYPQLVKPDYLDNILVERASEMIIELMAERREEYVYYIAMMPEERMISAVSSIIVSSDAIDTFLWRKLRQLIPEQTYTTLIKTTVSRYVAVRGNYLQASNKIQELLGDQQLSSSYLAQMLVRHHLKTQTFPLDQIARAEQMGLRGSLDSQPYERVFHILVKARIIQELLVIRDEIRLWDFLSSNTLVIVESKLACFMAEALEKLSQFGGIQIYFGLVKDSVKAAQICLSRQRKLSDLRTYKGFVLESCERLLSSNKLSEFSADPFVSDLLNYLRETY